MNPPITPQITDMRMPMAAPFPAELAFNGVLSLQAKYSIKPTSGNNIPNAIKPELGASSAELLLIPSLAARLFGTAQPQCGHTTASSTISLPQCVQNFII